MNKEELLGMGVPEEAAEKILLETRGIRVESAAKLALAQGGARNIVAAMALLKRENLEISEGGEIKGLAEQVSALQKGEDTAFLFGTEKLSAFKPAESSGDVKKPTGEMSYDELCRHFN
ncbi:MAG: phage scaffolding protein [Oscillospiraceae bacterium]